MRIACIADTHFGCRSDSEVFLEQHRKFFEDIFFPAIDKYKIKKVIHLGDLFDKPRTINVKTLSAVSKIFIDPIKERELECHIIPGNHDTYYRDSLSITTVEEVLGSSPLFHVYSTPKSVNIEGVKFGFLPWGSNDFPKADVLCAHLDLVGFEMYKGVTNLDQGLSSLDFAKKYKLVLSGHYHHPSQKGNINYIGAPIEMIWSDYGGPRGFAILDTDDLSLGFIQNPSRVFRKMSYDDTGKTLEKMLQGDFSVFTGICAKVNVKSCSDRYILEQFIKKIEEHDPFSLTVVENEGNMVFEDEINAEESTIDVIDTYIDGISLTVDKDRLKGFMKDLYIEAEKAATTSQTI